MPARDLAMSATGMSGIKSITFRESFSQAAATAEVECTAHTLAVGSTSTVHLGISGDEADFISSGIVKEIKIRRPSRDYLITVYDPLVKAVDYFIASDDPLVPFMANNVSAETLVQNLLSLAGLTAYASDATGFTFGVPSPKPINLVSVWDAVESIARIVGFIVYADSAGTIQFRQRKPYIVGGDVSSFSFGVGDTGSITDIDYVQSDEKLRNRVVVYGAPGIAATASAASGFLPAGFFKSILISHELIDVQSQAQSAADLNLTMFNRLTETVNLTVLGRTATRARSIVVVVEPFTGLSASTLWVVFATQHSINRQDGYRLSLTLTR